MGRMNDDVRNLDPAVSIAVATTISLAAEALDRQFGCGQGAARLCMAQAFAEFDAALASGKPGEAGE